MILKLLFLKFQIIRIVLTYDDGPTRYTHEILSLLNEHNIRAIFFPVACNDAKRSQKLLEFSQYNMITGNHTFCHLELRRNVPENHIFSEIEKQHDFLIKNNISPTLFRYPGGVYNKKAITVLKKLGYKMILFWDVFFYKNTSIQELYQKILRFPILKQNNVLVVLIHDCYKNAVDATKMIVENFHYKAYFVENKIVFFIIAPPERVFSGGCNHGTCVGVDSFVQ